MGRIKKWVQSNGVVYKLTKRNPDGIETKYLFLSPIQGVSAFKLDHLCIESSRYESVIGVIH